MRKQKELNVILSILVTVAVLLVGLPFALTGQKNMTGEVPEVEKTDAVTCIAEGKRYPYLESKIDEMGRKIQVDMKFDEGKVEVMGLRYDVEYVNDERAGEAFGMLTPELSMVMGQNGVSTQMAANARLAKNGNHVLMILYLPKDDMSSANAKMMMIESEEVVVRDRESLVENYTRQSFNCN